MPVFEIVGSATATLQKGTITVAENSECSAYQKFFDPKSMACVGKVSDGQAICLVSVDHIMIFVPDANKGVLIRIYDCRLAPEVHCRYQLQMNRAFGVYLPCHPIM